MLASYYRKQVLEALISLISFRDWTFHVGVMGDGHYIQVQFRAKDSTGGPEQNWNGRKWYISQHATNQEVIQTCFKAVMTAMEHEVREEFKYRDVAVFQPHMDLDALVDLAQTKVLRPVPV